MFLIFWPFWKFLSRKKVPQQKVVTRTTRTLLAVKNREGFLRLIRAHKNPSIKPKFWKPFPCFRKEIKTDIYPWLVCYHSMLCFRSSTWGWSSTQDPTYETYGTAWTAWSSPVPWYPFTSSEWFIVFFSFLIHLISMIAIFSGAHPPAKSWKPSNSFVFSGRSKWWTAYPR